MESIKEVYETYEKYVFNYIYGLTLDFYLAEELTQETFFQVVKSFHKFRGDSQVSTWIYKIARNVYYQYLRKNTSKLISIEAEEFDLREKSTTEEELDKKEKNILIKNSLMNIQESQREVLWLRDWQELSYEEISIITGKSLSWVKVNIHRARKEFKKNYREGDLDE